ncbi:C40 family peptidase [Kangiella koreensis]|uniref:NLP/P60 protein n=1 Tax=Kangiella koreensis (strain DSM 16069 / JCM 12317 / KCTC 12182 / SW-125) TaxID=523791 RepID=C7RCL1_KANKD|nr:C40 family peptidase [Kangiella koreensis]ACV27003.1 NLP/P60 protein [Kangiella koreensis DSM 16069]
MNKKLSLFILIVVSSLWLAACSSTPERTISDSSRQSTQSRYEATSDKGENIALMAQSMLGKRYRYGGSTPKQGFDCSGLVYFTHTQVGDYVPRTSRDQLYASREVRIEELQPGDLLFYRINGKPSHVGIYIGNKQFVHAPSSGKTVSVTTMDNPYFKPRLIRAGRLYKE